MVLLPRTAIVPPLAPKDRVFRQAIIKDVVHPLAVSSAVDLVVAPEDLPGKDWAGGFKVSAAGLEDSLHSLEVGAHIAEEARYASECLSCSYFDLCGGGYLQHRWGGGSYKNPSVYCEDYKLLFRAVEGAAA